MVADYIVVDRFSKTIIATFHSYLEAVDYIRQLVLEEFEKDCYVDGQYGVYKLKATS